MSIDSQLSAIFNRKRRKLVEAGLMLEGKLKQNIAVDTGKLEDSIYCGDVQEDSAMMKIQVGTDGTGYARKVEDGEGVVFNYGRKEPRRTGKKWSGTRKIIATGIGLHSFKKTRDAEMKNVIDILKS